jgi:nitrite reductase (NO-forming)
VVEILSKEHLVRKILGLLTLAALALLLAVACGGPATPQPEAAPTAKQPVDLPPLLKATVPPPITRTEPAVVKLELEIKELDARLDDGVGYTYWTYNGSVPGPFVRVRVGDTVELTLKNPQGNSLPHNIDLHAVNGPGGGATLTNVRSGEVASFRFKALNPGVYIYHCAFPPVPHHISKGMYGLILVEPEGGMPPVDKEFSVVQGDIYIDGQRGDKGLRGDSLTKLVSEQADYVVFNGSVGSLMGENALKAAVGDTVRIYFGVGGPNVISSFHVIGEVFDRVYPEGALANPHYNVQTTLVPAGGATMVEFKIDVPGTYLLVDHSLSRLFKGAVGQIVATGSEDPAVFGPMR